MNREFYANSITDFLTSSETEILGILAANNDFALEGTQRSAWQYEIHLLQSILQDYTGWIALEYAIPRMGRRIDALLIIDNALLILEFKVGERHYLTSAYDQVWDYALDLKNFHQTSHHVFIAPILIATAALDSCNILSTSKADDQVLSPICCNATELRAVIEKVLQWAEGTTIDIKQWREGRYSPTPTIIEAARAMYATHSVADITRNEADIVNLTLTTATVHRIIEQAQAQHQKAICFVTGVPGAGKTLVGLNIATQYDQKTDDKKVSSVFLSGNGPLVAILQEALVRDRVAREKEKGAKLTKKEAARAVKQFIQNVHHFRDDCLKDPNPPFEHVAIFDEAQRAWTKEQTINFMRRKKGVTDFDMSEPAFLISCMDRHPDWSAIICLVGGGQEINTGEAGIREWIDAINDHFPEWQVYISSQLSDVEYAAGEALALFQYTDHLHITDELHLAVSMRSYRAENVSLWVKKLLDRELSDAQQLYQQIQTVYPIVLTRDISKAKQWLKSQARGTQRYGIVVSSQAQRLKPYAIDVKSPMDPVHWFLEDKADVRSSYYLEDVATEFHVQGLELDWACITWDADFRYATNDWETYSFVSTKWHNILKKERKEYLKNAYRVLLTRARQGMVIVVPAGEAADPTRLPLFYDSTYNYLKTMGLQEI